MHSNHANSIVALIGRPNVGKSTLFNRITRSRQAIVDPTPGVTRDRHYRQVNWKGRNFMLVDTGGIEKKSDDAMVDTIREQALAAIEEADSILFLMDGKAGLMPADYDLVEMLRRTEKPVFFCRQ
jgi:GTP-binding protein